MVSYVSIFPRVSFILSDVVYVSDFILIVFLCAVVLFLVNFAV